MKTKKFALLLAFITPSIAMGQSWLDLTSEYIVNPNFDNNQSTGWTYTSNASSQQLNYEAMEFWNGTFDIYQTVNVPNGKYRISVQAYYRTANNSQDAYRNFENGTEDITAFLYANETRVNLVSIYSESSTTNIANGCWGYSTSNNWQDRKYIYFPNNMESASQFFAEGKYTNVLEVEVTDGTLKFGLINENYSANNWCMFDNFRIEYYGTETPVIDISLSENNLTMIEGETKQLTAKITPENATFNKIIWESADPEIASVDQKGNVTAKQKGETTILVYSQKYNDVIAECNVIIEENREGTSSLIINEIQSSNIDMFVDPSFNYGGWVELYNPTDKTVSLYGLYISDDPKNLKKFRLSIENGVVPAKGFKNIWFDHHNVNNSQTNFKLDFDGGMIFLSNSSGEIIASQDYPIAVPRTSYARIENGGNSWGLTAMPTPEKSNESSVFAVGRVEAPSVDKDGQLFVAPIVISVNIPEGTTLRYTTDGTTPTLENGLTTHTGIFRVSSTTTYRFRLFKEGMLPSAVVTRSYILKDREIFLPVVSVVTDPVNLYDDSLGIYVRGVNGRTGNGQRTPCNWNMDWDRPVNFEYFTTEGEMVINQEVDMAMCGGWSRAWEPHSFKLKAEKIYEGKNFYEYPIFETKPYLKHKTLQIRNGGNDTGSRLKDPALQEIVRTSGLNVDGQAYQPIVHYINGEYKGMLNIREPNNKHFAYANYGYDSEELDQFEMSPDSGYCQMTGTEDSFLEWYNLSSNATDPTTYEQICSMVDIDEYINYMAVEFYLGATDWPQNNLKGFKPRFEGGKFRFVLFDLDGTFGTNTPFSTFEWKKDYTFDEIYDTGERLHEEIKFVTIFLNMLENETFRKKFIDTYCLVAGSVFTPERCKEIINKMAEYTYPTLRQESQNPYNTGNNLINSLNNRQQLMINDLKNYWRFQLTNVTEQKVKLSSNIDDALLTVNGMMVPTNKFNGSLFSPITLNVKAPSGYRFLGWQNASGQVMTEKEIFGKGYSWKYYDQGSLDNEAWTQSDFTASTWQTGKAPLGYSSSNSEFNTILDYGSDGNNKRPTYYFRKSFVLSTTPSSEDIFTLNFTADDGFIVYINGQEAGRYLMPTGDVNYNTLASTYANGNPDNGTLSLPMSLFKRGANTIAVEVHNNSVSSSDIYFDAALIHKSFTSADANYVCETEEFIMPNSGDLELIACYEKLSDEELAKEGQTPVKINEICASNSIYINEYFEKNDWIELYNTTDNQIDVAGMYISDNIKKPLKYQIPSDENINTIIEPYGFLIIWADKLNPISQIHTSFKLGADGGEVLLTSENEEWCDTLIYPPHNSDISVGLYPDGGKDVYIMTKQTLAATNVINSYSELWTEPIIPNSIHDVHINRNGGLSIAFNGNEVEVRSEEREIVSINVYNISGQLCLQKSLTLNGYSQIVSLSTLPEGTYVVKATDSEDNRCSIKIFKK